MRIWSLHPKYLDVKGLVALWRETLLAKHVLEGLTKGYKHHPQLHRFKNCSDPTGTINYYLMEVWKEAKSRNYNFNADKIHPVAEINRLTVTEGQLLFEKNHLLNKLSLRDAKLYNSYKNLSWFEPHPLFQIVDGEVEPWEII